MQKSLIVLLSLIITGCQSNIFNTFVHKKISSCPQKPQQELKNNEVSSINLDNNFLEKSDKIDKYSQKGYIFKGMVNQNLNIKTSDNICIWLYTPDLQRISVKTSNISLVKTGQYIVHIFENKGLNQYDINLNLSLSPTLKIAKQKFESQTKRTLLKIENEIISQDDSINSQKEREKNRQKIREIIKQELQFDGDYDKTLNSDGKDREKLILTIAKYQTVKLHNNSNGIISPYQKTYQLLKLQVNKSLYPFSEEQAVNLMNTWLTIKTKLFAAWKHCNKLNQNSASCQDELKKRYKLAKRYTTGKRYKHTKKNLDDIAKVDNFYDYKTSKINKIISFSASDKVAFLTVEITEQLSVRNNKGLVKNYPQHTSKFDITFSREGNQWKISDTDKIK